MNEKIGANLNIVKFDPKYQDRVIKLIDRTLKDVSVIPDTPELIDDEDLFKIPEIYSGRGCFWVALDGDDVVGTVAIRDLGDNQAKLNRMFVKKNLHGTGLGQQLLNQALKYAREQKYENVHLNTHHLMERAHHFYEKNGFQRVGGDEESYFYVLRLK